MNANVGKIFQGPAGYAIAIGVAGIVLYVLWERLTGVIKDSAAAAGGLATGNNVITQNQTNFDREATDAYEGRGVGGTLGAAANTVSGGALASIGEWLGGKLADWTDDYDPNAPAQLRSTKQAIGDNFYDKGFFE
jgi:hypothetical protein